MNASNKTAPVPCTGKRRKYNADRTWRGRSYRKGGKNIRALRDAQIKD
jgi:hypothetical protein